MSSISFTAHGRCARATYCEPITTGSVGLSVSFAFDAAWSGLQKTAIFRGSGMAVDLVLSGDAATVPPEVLTIPGGDLRVGVWGADPDGNVIIPTVWATVGEIVPGAAPSGFDPDPPTPSWAAQVQEIAQDALDTANSVREDADAGAFDGATYTPTVSADGDLSWTNDKGKPNPPTVNIKGPEGQPGQTGATPDISIGTVETLPPGSPAKATITGTAENPVLSFGIPQGQQGAPGEVTQAEFDALAGEVTQQKSAIEALEALTNRKAGMLVDTASGSIASFVPDATIDHLLGLDVAVEPVQDLHGYDNPWPAGGGKNKFDASILTEQVSWKIVVLTLPPGTYTMSTNKGSTTDTNLPLHFRLTGNNTLGTGNAVYVNHPITVTIPDDGTAEVVFRRVSGDKVFSAYWYQIEAGSNATTYVPYENLCPISGWDAVSIWNKPTHDTTADPTVTIQLGQTVYGAKLTISEGGSVNALVDRVTLTLDGSVDEAWMAETIDTVRQYFRLPVGAFGYIVADDVLSNIYTQAVITGGTTAVGINVVNSAGYNVAQISVRPLDVSVMTIADFRAQLAANPLQVVYRLSTPIEIQFAPVTISTISGQTNNVWANTGDVSVEFAADLKHYIDSKIAAAVAALS